jgi:ribosomal protein S27AE
MSSTLRARKGQGARLDWGVTRDPLKVAAGEAARRALKAESLTKPDSCEQCGRTVRLVMHHVRFVCYRCHAQIHGPDKRLPRPVMAGATT